MASILLVEDDEFIRTMITRVLRRAGHEVVAADSGEAAIAAGVQSRPDLLVTDWMLSGRLHGLHVARVLRLLDPGVPAVLMTGFPSEDLVSAIATTGATELLPKPFRVAHLLAAVARAEAGGRLPLPKDAGGAGVMELDRRSRIIFENPAATVLLDRVRRPWRGIEESLLDLIHPRDRVKLRGADDRWVELSPLRNQALRWALRARPTTDPDRRIFALCRASDHASRSDPQVNSLLGIGNATPHRWPFEGRLLLIGGEAETRSRAAEMLEPAGCTVFSVDSAELGLRLLAADDGIHYALVDFTGPEADVRRALVGIRDLRPDVAVIGCAGNRADDREFEVDISLAHGWTPAELIQAIAQYGEEEGLSAEPSSRAEGGSLSRVRDSRIERPPSSLQRVRI